MSESLSNKAKTLDRYIMNLPMSKSMNTMSRQEQVAMLDLRDGASMLRVAVTKYFASDDLDEKRITQVVMNRKYQIIWRCTSHYTRPNTVSRAYIGHKFNHGSVDGF